MEMKNKKDIDINKKGEDKIEINNLSIDNFSIANFYKSKFLSKEINRDISINEMFHEITNSKLNNKYNNNLNNNLNKLIESEDYVVSFYIKNYKKIVNILFLNEKNKENYIINLNLEEKIFFINERPFEIDKNIKEVVFLFENSKKNKNNNDFNKNNDKNNENEIKNNQLYIINISGKIKNKDLTFLFNSDNKIMLQMEMLYETEIKEQASVTKTKDNKDFKEIKANDKNNHKNNGKSCLNIFMKQQNNISSIIINNNKKLNDLIFNYLVLSNNKFTSSINEVNIINKNDNTNLNVNIFGLIKRANNISNLVNVFSTNQNKNSQIEEEIKIIDIGDDFFRNLMIPMYDVRNNTSNCNHKAQLIKLDEKNLYYLMTRGFNFNDSRKIVLKSILKDYEEFLDIKDIEDFLE